MSASYRFHKFSTAALGFLARAEEHLDRFERDEGVFHFFYAALELRLGIEARLNEYLGPALRSIGKEKDEITEYVATKLLKQLVSIDPDATRASTLRITEQQSGHASAFQFTPVSPRLASIHGQLGGLLHYQFFNNNKHWNLRKPLGGNPHRSLADYVALLRDGVAELRHATSGSLLSNPRFTSLVEQAASGAPEVPDERPGG